MYAIPEVKLWRIGGLAQKDSTWVTVSLSDTALWRYRFAMAGAEQEEIRAERGALFGSTCDAAQRIPSFTLRVSLHGKFWEEMKGVLKSEEVSIERSPVFKR